METAKQRNEIATFGGGCFWCLEAVFDQLRGVDEVVSGYCGGTSAKPGYAEVCDGDSGHAEVVRLQFDPAEISYRDLLEVFFAIHDPTTLDRQGHDVGSQYRSVIFTHTPEQEETARAFIAELNAGAAFPAPIVTAVESAKTFWPAEDYHQRYFAENPRQPYCQAVVGPKLAKFRGRFAGRLKASG
jgi:peptide-methionine (S)-S-oxide reductase